MVHIVSKNCLIYESGGGGGILIFYYGERKRLVSMVTVILIIVITCFRLHDCDRRAGVPQEREERVGKLQAHLHLPRLRSQSRGLEREKLVGFISYLNFF